MPHKGVVSMLWCRRGVSLLLVGCTVAAAAVKGNVLLSDTAVPRLAPAAANSPDFVAAAYRSAIVRFDGTPWPATAVREADEELAQEAIGVNPVWVSANLRAMY